MSNQLAIVLGVIVLGALGLDHFLNDNTALLFTARKFEDLIEYLAFWR